MTAPGDAAVQALLAKEAIREVVYRRARATDARDVELSLSCYHEGATENHEGFDGPIEEYLRAASPALASSVVETCFHLIGNVEIELDGDRARSQSHFLCTMTAAAPDGTRTDYINAGRYLDDFARRDGRWAIVRRVCVYDWGRSDPPATRWWERAHPPRDRGLTGPPAPGRT